MDNEHDSFLISVLAIATSVRSRRSAEVYVGILCRHKVPPVLPMHVPSLQTLDIEISVVQHGGTLDLLILDLFK